MYNKNSRGPRTVPWRTSIWRCRCEQ